MSTASGNLFDKLFVGRREYLEEFERLINEKANYRVLFIPGEGGIGKTWLLRKMLALANEKKDLNNLLPPDNIIDTYSTANHSIDGVQEQIVALLKKTFKGECFTNYKKFKHEIDVARREGFDEETRSDFEKKARKAFIDDCKTLSESITPIIFLDTFERVQREEVGRWILFDMIPELPRYKFVITGREACEEKSYIHLYTLRGFTDEEAMEYFLHKRGLPEAPDFADVLSAICEKAKGRPLFIDLAISWFSDEQLRDSGALRKLTDDDFQKALIAPLQQQQGVFGDAEKDIIGQDTIRNMAYYHHRFNARLLQRWAEKQNIILPAGMSSEDILGMIEDVYPFVKRLPDGCLQHHDEIERLIMDYWWPEYDRRGDIRQGELAPIAVEWYEELLSDSENESIFDDLRAEQLAYMMDIDLEQSVQRIEEYDFSQRLNELLVSGISQERLREFPPAICYRYATNLGKRATRRDLYEQAQAFWKLALEVAEQDDSSVGK